MDSPYFLINHSNSNLYLNAAELDWPQHATSGGSSASVSPFCDDQDLAGFDGYLDQQDGSEENDFHVALGGFVNAVDTCADISAESDAGYISGVDIFSSASVVDCSDSSDAYCFKLSLDNHVNGASCNNLNSYSDSQQAPTTSTTIAPEAQTTTTTTTLATAATKQKRSVLMNLLIDGSDVGAGYNGINCRSLQSNHHH